MNDDRAVYVRQLIAARCPELSVDEVIEAFAPGDDLDGDEMIPGRIVMQIMEVIDRMSERQDRYEAQLAAAEPITLPPRLH